MNQYSKTRKIEIGLYTSQKGARSVFPPSPFNLPHLAQLIPSTASNQLKFNEQFNLERLSLKTLIRHIKKE